MLITIGSPDVPVSKKNKGDGEIVRFSISSSSGKLPQYQKNNYITQGVNC